jgi:hypothetical protein
MERHPLHDTGEHFMVRLSGRKRYGHKTDIGCPCIGRGALRVDQLLDISGTGINKLRASVWLLETASR